MRVVSWDWILHQEIRRKASGMSHEEAQRPVRNSSDADSSGYREQEKHVARWQAVRVHMRAKETNNI